MALSAFADKKHSPSESELRATLGVAFSTWRKLLDAVAERIGTVDEVWGFTSASTGWGLRVKNGDRVILYMTPQAGHFLVSFALGEKAVAATQSARLATFLRDAIAAAPRYAEGRGVRVSVTRADQVASLATLAQIKSQH